MASDNYSRVKEIFTSAINIPPKERLSFLKKECSGDVELQKEVERLLDSYDSQFMERPAIAGFARSIYKNNPDWASTKISDNTKNKGASTELVAGTRLGRYRIVSKIGSGGMGDVYLAHDTSLDRKAALKLLPTTLTNNQESLKRFEHEARAVSALNHPYILTIYEFGKSDEGEHFIATEYVEGETLDEYCRTTGTSLRKNLGVAIQIASALAAAHETGIIHRDIKPENIIVRPDGFIKVLDFGLAKLTEEHRNPDAEADATTRPIVKTSSGIIMGTTPYMSPEQIRGREVDARTDIWSLGIVLYQMVSGRLPFDADTTGDTIAAVLRAEFVPLSECAEGCPAELERIVRKTLRKDRDKRYGKTSELGSDLKNLRDEVNVVSKQNDPETDPNSLIARTNPEKEKTRRDLVAVTNEQTSESRLPRYRWLGWGAAALFVTIFVYFYLPNPFGGDGIKDGSSLMISEVDSWKSSLGEMSASPARFSPTGKLIAYTSTKGGSRGIWLKQLNKGEPWPPKKDGSRDRNPIFSPDGEQIAFLSDRGDEAGIWAMPTFGGTAKGLKFVKGFIQNLVRWSNDGKTIYFEQNKNLLALNIASKEVRTVASVIEPKIEPGYRISPDEKRIVYVLDVDGKKDIWIDLLSGGNPSRVTNSEQIESNPIWHPDNKHVFFNMRQNDVIQIFRVALDGKPPMQLTFGGSDKEVTDVSQDGNRVLFYSASVDSDLWSAVIDSGESNQITSEVGIEIWSAVSPNGESIAYQALRGTNSSLNLSNNSIYSQKIINQQNLLPLAEKGFLPRWSPDGKSLAFLRSEKGIINLWVVSADGGEAKQLTNKGVTFGGRSNLPFNRIQNQDFQWSNNGDSVIYCARRNGISNLWRSEKDGSREVQISNNTTPGVWYFGPSVSSDGQQIAWLAMSTPTSADKRFSWSLKLHREGRTNTLFESDSILSLVGWAQSGREIVVGSAVGFANPPPELPIDITIFRIPTEKSGNRKGFLVKAAYFANFSLSPSKRMIAFVATRDGKDSIHVMPSKGGSSKVVSSSDSKRVFFSSLAWSPDEKTIYYGRQSNLKIISILENIN